MTNSSDEPTPDPTELLRSPAYVGLLLFGAIVGVPVAAVSYFFLKAVAEAQQYVFTTLPENLGFDSQPGVVADPAAHALRSAGRAHDPLPSR